MPLKGRDHNPSGLGRAIINRKAKDAMRVHQAGSYDVDPDAVTNLKSVTQERNLDEFLNTAQLAETDFTAERRNVKIIQQTATATHNPYLLSDQEERKTLTKHLANKQRLRVPRRPPWIKAMTTAQLETREKAAFLEWRRGLAQLQEEDQFLLTPFERNLEVWRQLWRVLERSQLVVQIVDARNPLRFRCEDLENYVYDVEGAEGERGTGKGKRTTLLLVNKADLLTAEQRKQWADYFDEQKIQYAFFSAANAAAIQQARRDALAAAQRAEDEEEERRNAPPTSDDDEEDGDGDADADKEEESSEDGGQSSQSGPEPSISAEEEDEVAKDPRIKVLSVLELEDLFTRAAPDLSVFKSSDGTIPSKLTVGLVGYPNVGKSSTINALLGEKKVSVSSTPGKTKHFQTINLSETMVLCDCPGLVFPQFATTKAALVCDGVLPIDQMREYTGPTGLIVKRIPRNVLEATYGLKISIQSTEDGKEGEMTASDLLVAYATARGYMRSGLGQPDEARSARYILKDYVNAKLLFCQPPPDVDETGFNAKTHEIMLKSATKKRPTHFVDTPGSAPPRANVKSSRIDENFFDETNGSTARPFVDGHDGKPLGPKYARIAAVLANQEPNFNGKKHHKKMKREKQRGGGGYD